MRLYSGFIPLFYFNQNVLVIDKRKLIRKDIKDAKHNVNNSSHNFEQSLDRIINFDESIQSNHSIEKNDTKIQNNSRIDMSNIQNYNNNDISFEQESIHYDSQI